MFSAKSHSHKGDTAFQLQEVPLQDLSHELGHELSHELGLSSYQDRNRLQDSPSDPSGLGYSKPQSVTSTMKLRRSNSWGDVDLRDPESVPPSRWVLTAKRSRLFWWALRYLLIFVVVFVALLVPIILFISDAGISDDDTLEDIEQKQYRNLVFYLFLWLELSWVSYISFDIIGLTFPYLFRLIARYVNSSHYRYWRVFKLLRRPICFLFGTAFCFIFFTVFVNLNPLLGVNIQKGENDVGWDDIIDDILERLMIWVAFYFVEKIVITYIAVHYHYRRCNVAISRGKEVHNALALLYQASISVYPEHDSAFAKEDLLIRNATGKTNSSARIRLTSYLARLHMDTYKVVSFFGSFVSDSPESHWLRASSPYAIVDRTWTDETAAAALATRVWKSLVANGQQEMTKKDISDVLGQDQDELAGKLFKVLDENESGGIELRDFVGLVKETGAMRQRIYKGIVDMNHCVNTFDWVCLVILATIMIFFIIVTYVPAIKEIQTILQSLAIGLSFAVGRTFNHLITGIIFVFFDHPFDTGDIVHFSNAGVPNGPAFCVKRQSLLYTIFRRMDNNTDVQISNEQLAQRNIENYTRSGINRQGLSMFIDIRTSFKDLARLRKILEAFLADNARNYVPNTLGFSVVSLHELNKMELKLGFTHRSNWSDDKLRAQRSNKFYCALVAACRSIPIYAPGSMSPGAGSNGNPMYIASVTDTMALSENIQKEKDRRQGLRWDSEERLAAEGADTDGHATAQGHRPVKPKDQKAEEEEQALLGLTQVTAAKGKPVSSTGVDTSKSAIGLRGRVMR